MIIDHSKEKLETLICFLNKNIPESTIEKITNLLIIIDYKHFSKTGRTITNYDYSKKINNLNKNELKLELFSKKEMFIIEHLIRKYKSYSIDDFLNDKIIKNINFLDKELMFEKLYIKLMKNYVEYDILKISRERKEFIEHFMKSSELISLDKITSLKYNWNGYGSEPIPKKVIKNCKFLLNDVDFLKDFEIFPTARKSIQLELTKNNIYYEIEIYSDKYEVYIEENNIQKIDQTFDNITKLINFLTI